MIPKYNEMYKEVLEAIKNQKEYTTKEYKEIIANKLNISIEERKKTSESGGNIYNTALSWTIFYLKKAKLIEKIQRGVIKITQRGLDLLATNPEKIDNETLRNYPEFNEFINPKKIQENKKLK